uniref:FBA_2 domain-containing protein n=1 Tax=Panagrellus redivivus TaxID=6233 RepID=A0A7E4VGQ7_PANRE
MNYATYSALDRHDITSQIAHTMERDAIAAAFQHYDMIERFFKLSPCPLQCIAAGTVWEDLYWLDRDRQENLSGFTYAFNLNISNYKICIGSYKDSDITCYVSETKKVKPLRRLINYLNERSVCIMGDFRAINSIPGVIEYLLNGLTVRPFFTSALIENSWLTPGDVTSVARLCFQNGPIKFYYCKLVEPVNICEILSSISNPRYLELDIRGIDYSPPVTKCRCSYEALQYCEMIRMEYLPDDWRYRHFFIYVMKNGALTRLQYIYLTFQNTIVTQKYVKEVYKEAVTIWKNYPSKIYCIADKPMPGQDTLCNLNNRDIVSYFGWCDETGILFWSKNSFSSNEFYYLRSS